MQSCFLTNIVQITSKYTHNIVHCSYGMIGVCASDYVDSGGWDPKWGYHWGAEDVDLIHRLQDKLPYTVRVKENGYIHQHSEENRQHSKYVN